VQRAVARQPRGPRVPRDLRPDRLRPHGYELDQAPRRLEAGELALCVLADPLEPAHATVRADPGRTSTSWAGSTGSAETDVAVTSA
jgi:hypothetical protein